MLPRPQASKQAKHLCRRFQVFILQQLLATGRMYVDHQLKSKIKLIQISSSIIKETFQIKHHWCRDYIN